MQIQQLVYFIEIAKQGSINRAAEKLFVTQPNLSKAISNMESELGLTILERTNKGVMLTPEGKELYQYARAILNQIELIEGMKQKEPLKILSVSSYPIITMGRIVSRFYNMHQSETISIRLVEERIRSVMDHVENGEAEIGFCMVNNAQIKEFKSSLSYKKLQFHLLGTDTWYANIGAANPLYSREEVTIQELLQHPFVRLPDDYFSNLTHYLRVGGVPLVEFKRHIHVNDSAAIISVLQNTDAVRFGPSISSPDFAACGIRSIPVHDCGVLVHTGWINRKNEMLSPAAQDFVALLSELYPSPREPHGSGK